MSLFSTLALSALGLAVPGLGTAIAIWKFGKDEVLGGLKKAASYLFLHPMTAVAIAAALLALFEWQDARHWKKADTGHVALIAGVTAEVDRGVGQPTRPDQAPIWIRRFVDNVNALSGALDRQSKALVAAKTDANAHDDGAHQAAQPTADERQRDKIRKQLKDPARVDGADTDWGRL